MDTSGSGYGPMTGSCEHGNEPSGSTEAGEFDWLLASQGVCSM